MKKLLKLLIILIFFFSGEQILAQGVLDFGKNFYTVKKMADNKFGNTCDGSGKVLIYCVSDGSKISLMFRDNQFSDLQFWNPYSSKRIAELELEKQINEFSKEQNMTPYYSGGFATFTTAEMAVGVSFSIVEFKKTSYVRKIYQYEPLLSYPISQ